MALGWYSFTRDVVKYGTNSTFTIHACNHVLPWFLSCLKVSDMDFISIFFDWSGPRLVLIFTIHRKTRCGMRVTVPKYRFLSIGEALRKSHFLSLSWASLSFSSFPSLFPYANVPGFQGKNESAMAEPKIAACLRFWKTKIYWFTEGWWDTRVAHWIIF